MTGFNSVLSAQALFPIASPDEMAGHYNENEISKAIRKGQVSGKDGAWNKVAQRIRNNPKYVALFKQSLDKVTQADDIQFTDIANAIADFIAFEWQAVDSPFDNYLSGNKDALTPEMKSGMTLFYGKAGCSNCHSGSLQTDHSFHSIAMPQFGPGKTARFETEKNDTGRLRVTGIATDAYKFRTPSLRNVALTAPYGHSGAFMTLTEIIEHHLNPVESLTDFEMSKLILPTLNVNKPQLVSHEEIEKIAKANELKPIELSGLDVQNLEAFLHALTDSNKGKGRLGEPDQVPSGLAFD
jgi:cytochrome c peroxidase